MTVIRHALCSLPPLAACDARWGRRVGVSVDHASDPATPASFRFFRFAIADVRSRGRRCRQSEALPQSLDPHLSALSVGDGLAACDPILPGKLTGTTVRSEGHGDADAPGLVVGEVGSPLREG